MLGVTVAEKKPGVPASFFPVTKKQNLKLRNLYRENRCVPLHAPDINQLNEPLSSEVIMYHMLSADQTLSTHTLAPCTTGNPFWHLFKLGLYKLKK